MSPGHPRGGKRKSAVQSRMSGKRMGPGWAGGREESVPGNAGGRTTCSVITVGPRSLWTTWLKIQSLFRCPQRMVHPPTPGHLRVRLKNGTWTGPNGFPCSLRALSVLVRGVWSRNALTKLSNLGNNCRRVLPKSRQKKNVSETMDGTLLMGASHLQ